MKTLDMFAPVAAPKNSRSHGAQGDPATVVCPASPGFVAHETARDGEKSGTPESPGGRMGAGVTAPEAPAPRDLDVQIVRLTFGITTHAWLCRDCRAERKAAGWTVEPVKATIGVWLSCDDCDYRGQKAVP